MNNNCLIHSIVKHKKLFIKRSRNLWINDKTKRFNLKNMSLLMEVRRIN